MNALLGNLARSMSPASQRWRLAGAFLSSAQQLAGETPALPGSGTGCVISRSWTLLVLTVALNINGTGSAASAEPRGKLFIIGGGRQPPEMTQRFIEFVRDKLATQ